MKARMRNRIVPAFNKAADDGRSTDVISAILRERPDLQGLDFISPRQGKLAHTFIAGAEVFKAPVEEAFAGDLEDEIAIQKSLSGVPEVPEVTTEGSDAYFFGMKKLPGIPLSGVFKNMTEKQKYGVAFSIGRIKAACDKAFQEHPCDGLPVVRTYKQAWETYSEPEVRLNIKEMDENLCAMLDDYFARCRSRGNVLMHRDLNFGNVLVHKRDRNVTGLIDWGLAKVVGAPEVEMIQMVDHWKFENGFVDAMFDGYAIGQEGVVKQSDPVLCRAVMAVSDLLADYGFVTDSEFQQKLKYFRAEMMFAVDKHPGRWPYPTICGERLRQQPGMKR